MNIKDIKKKGLILIIIFIMCWLFAFGRLFYLQIIQSGEMGRESIEEQVRFLETTARRGDILDRYGRVLATDLKLFTLYVEKSRIKNLELASNKLAEYGIGSVDGIRDMLQKDAKLIKLARGVSDSVVKNIEVEGVYAVREWFRYYTSGDIGRTFVGALNWERKGISGVEREYNGFLSGEKGWAHYLEVPMYSGIKLLKRHEQDYRDPIPGCDIYLTIDMDLQYIFDNVLSELRERTKADQVFGICLDVNSGEILAMVNLPEFQPDNGWRNNGCIAWQFEPGSIFKIIPAYTWIRKGLPVVDTVVDSTGSIEFGGKNFRDPHEHPAYTFREAMINSSNAGFVQIGKTVGKREMYRSAQSLGIGCKTGIDLPVEYPGKLPVLEKMRDIRLATVSFGQGVNTTPLQMVMAYQAVANSGVLLRPHVMKEIKKNGRTIERAGREIIRRAGAPEEFNRLLEILRATVKEGTALSASVSLIPVAGKTGTAWKYADGSYIEGEYVSSFVGMFPHPEPEYVVGIFLDNPKGIYYSSITVCPAFREFVKRMVPMRNYRNHLL